MFKQLKWSEMAGALLLCIAGIVLILMPGLALVTIARFIGAIILTIGIILLISYFAVHAPGSYNLVFGIIISAAGLFCIIDSAFIVSILPIAFGVGIIISGAAKLQRAFDLMKMGAKLTGMLVTSVISVVIGVLVIVNPFGTAELLVRIIGIGFLYSGITDLISVIYVSKKTADYVKNQSTVDIKIVDDTDTVETVVGEVIDKE